MEKKLILKYFVLLWLAILASPAFGLKKTAIYNNVEELEKSGFKESIYTIDVNEEKKDRAEIILLKNNIPYIPEDELKTWRLKELPSCIIVKYLDKHYYKLDCFTGIHYKLDQDHLFLDITLPTSRFTETELAKREKEEIPLASPPKKPGGFLNYDLDFEHSAPQNSDNTNKYNGLFELGYFNSFGVGQTNFIYRDSNQETTANKIARLNTKWTYDDVDDMRRFQFGDVQSNNGILGRSILIGGIHIAKNYSMQPGTQIYPLPDIQPGTATVPSTVDFYLNNVRQFRKEVLPGPFDIDTFPTITGAGTIKVVTKDIFGKEQIMTLPYYYTTDLLKKGIHQYKFDVGFTRQNYGLENFDYGRFLISATDRYGLNDKVTLNGHAAFHANNLSMIDGGIDFLPNPKWGIITINAGASRQKNGKIGGFLSLGFNTKKRKWSFGAVTNLTTKNFLDLGYEPGSSLPLQQTRTYFSRQIGEKSSIGVSFTSQHGRNPTTISNVISGSFSTRLLKNWSLSISIQDNLNQKKDRAVRLSLSRRIFDNHNLRLGGTYKETGGDGQITISKSLNNATSWGYNISGEMSKQNKTTNKRGQGRLSYQNNIGTYHAEIAKDSNQTAYRLNAVGGALFFDGKPYLSRRNDSSFGIVEIPGYKNVRVYRNNVLVGRTNKNGKVVIPRLYPYRQNSLGIDANDLPLDTRIEGQTSQQVIPYYLSGVKRIFHIKKVYSVEFKLIRQNGQVIPEGAVIKEETAKDDDDEFYVDENGEVYLETLGNTNKFKAIGTDGECDFVVDIPENAKPVDLIYQLGTIRCKFEPYPAEKIAQLKKEDIFDDTQQDSTQKTAEENTAEVKNTETPKDSSQTTEENTIENKDTKTPQDALQKTTEEKSESQEELPTISQKHQEKPIKASQNNEEKIDEKQNIIAQKVHNETTSNQEEKEPLVKKEKITEKPSPQPEQIDIKKEIITNNKKNTKIIVFEEFDPVLQ